MTDSTSRAHDLVDALFGVPDRSANRAVQVIHAQAAALSWVREATGATHAPLAVARRLQEVANQLRSDERDPNGVLIQVAVEALDAERSGAA